MKKIFTLLISAIFVLCMAGTALAATTMVNIDDFSAKGDVSSATVSGSVNSNACTAVVVALLDTDGQTVLRTQSTSVKNDKTFSLEFDNLSLTAGSTYTAQAADYTGGAWTKKTFSVSSTTGSSDAVVPGNTATTVGSSAQNTGDYNNLSVWICLLLVAIGTCITLLAGLRISKKTK